MELEATWPDGEPWPGRGRVDLRVARLGGASRRSARRSTFPRRPTLSRSSGCDAANGTYFQLYSDERGVCRVYEMSIGDGEWKLWREGEPFSQRFTGDFSDDGNTITGRWEIAEDGTNYTTDFDLTYTRVE